MVKLHQELIHGLNTDCVEFCPDPAHPDWLVLGSYQLNEKTGERVGGIDLFRVERGSSSGAESTGAAGPYTKPRLVAAAAARGLPGVFDARWQQIRGEWALSLALSDGSLRLFRPPPLSADSSTGAAAGPAYATQQQQEEEREEQQQQQQQQQDEDGGREDHAGAGSSSDVPEMEEIDSCRATGQDMALCVDWAAPRSGPGGAPQHVAAVSGSGGGLALLQAAEAGLRRVNEWQAHELEAWCTAFDKHQPHLLYSGADDCTFKGWDCRAAAPAMGWQVVPLPGSCAGGGGGGGGSGSGGGDDGSGSGSEEEVSLAVFSNRRAHGAGVCCVAPHPTKEYLVATGSYDEGVRLWDVRRPARPAVVTQFPTGGGAWRLRWHPQDSHLLLVACMYNGFAIARASEAWDSMQIVETYKGHESIAYGADWHPAAAAAAAGADGDGGAASLVATCSFYDRRLHLWTPETLYHRC